VFEGEWMVQEKLSKDEYARRNYSSLDDMRNYSSLADEFDLAAAAAGTETGRADDDDDDDGDVNTVRRRVVPTNVSDNM